MKASDPNWRGHNSGVQGRIDRAREHYETRASRRPKGLSQSDVTTYDDAGFRRPPADTLHMRQQISQGAQIIREGNGYTTIFPPYDTSEYDEPNLDQYPPFEDPEGWDAPPGYVNHTRNVE